jgi:hypothetical protein
MTKKRPKIAYAETYRSPGVKIAREAMPETLPHIVNPRYVVDEMYLLSAGKLDDGREFQDLRVYLRRRE